MPRLNMTYLYLKHVTTIQNIQKRQASFDSVRKTDVFILNRDDVDSKCQKIFIVIL